MKSLFFLVCALFLFAGAVPSGANNPLFADESRAYALPTLAKNNKGEAVLYWTEKDDKNVVYLYLSVSKDGGKTFSDKKLIFADAGLGNGRLARPKLLFKKDGTMAAVFSFRSGGATPPREQKPAPTAHEGSHANHDKPTTAPASGGRPKRESQIRYTISKDGGNTWTVPVSVDSDPTPLVRGFFDAVVLPNDEIAVAYLKDVKNSTKHEERDLRMVITKNGVFQEEKLIDPVVCDCCNISLLVDSKGTLNVYYRDNNNDIRDIAKMTSADNGTTFSKSQILFNDQWQLKGCPHSGATSSVFGESALVSWFSGTATNSSGLRVVTNEGKRLFVLDNPTAKNSYLVTAPNASVVVWEQVKEKSEEGVTLIGLRKINPNTVSETRWVENSENGTNASVLVTDNEALVAYEVKQANKRNTIKVSTLRL